MLAFIGAAARTRRAIPPGMRDAPEIEELDRSYLARVIGGGADLGGILQAAGPLLGMIPGIGPIAQQMLPMIGQLAAGAGQQSQPQDSSGAAASAASTPTPGASAGASAQTSAAGASSASAGASAMPRHHRPSVSVQISQG